MKLIIDDDQYWQNFHNQMSINNQYQLINSYWLPSIVMRGNWQWGLELSLHECPNKEIWPSETEYQFSFKSKYGGQLNISTPKR